MTPLEPDRDQIAKFVEALFRRADPWTYATIRWFPDDQSGGTWRPALWRSHRFGGGTLVDGAVACARLCANAPMPVVFCPPVATFLKRGGGATDANIANGLTLSVECDENPAAARTALAVLLGPPTIVVASGGQWIDPSTGEVQGKAHCHWRLRAPTRTADEHNQLKLARRRAMRMIGGDATGAPVSHPYRWPGSWHRKELDRPRMVRIVEANDDTEIDLGDALARLPEGEEREFLKVFGRRGTTTVLTDYGKAALLSAATMILNAPNGKQEWTLNAQSFAIGTAAGAGIVPVALALDILLTAARALQNYDASRPWRLGQAEAKVTRSFTQGMARPRADWADIEREMARLEAEACDVYG